MTQGRGGLGSVTTIDVMDGRVGGGGGGGGDRWVGVSLVGGCDPDGWEHSQ